MLGDDGPKLGEGEDVRDGPVGRWRRVVGGIVSALRSKEELRCVRARQVLAGWGWEGGCRCFFGVGKHERSKATTKNQKKTLLSSCEALAFDGGDAHWEPLPPMHDARDGFACGAVAGCVIIAGGRGLKSDELYNEERNRWLRLPFDLPYVGGLVAMGSAAM